MIEEMKIKYNCEEICEEKTPECKNKNNKCSCIDLVIAILTTLFVGIIGVILGAALSSAILSALAAVIVLAITLLILLLLSIITAICCKQNNMQKCCCK